MTFDHDTDDPVVDALASLRTRDVHARRADRQRARCHALLREPPRRPSFERVIGPALGGAWCLAYVVEIIRRAVAMYGF